MKRIISIQHTDSIHHGNGMIGSWTDWDLSEAGKEQADRIGIRLAKELEGDHYILYSSDLLRARRTAEIAGARLGLSPILVPALRERYWGGACGKSYAWLEENRQCNEKTVDDRMLPDAESRRELWNRLLPFYRELMRSPHEKIILASHGDALSVFHAIWLGLDVEMLNRCDLMGYPGGVTFMEDNEDGKHFIRRHSDLSYMQAP